MLKIKPYLQSPGYCGPASLKMVLEYFGIEKSERTLGKMTGCTKKAGTSALRIIEIAKQLGLKAFIKDFAEIEDIRKFIGKKIPVIVAWFSVDDGHYSVVVGIDNKTIYLQDPEIGKIRPIELKIFKRIWLDFHGDFLKAKEDIVIRRMIVIHK